MGNLNKEQLEAINNLAKTSKDYNNGEAIDLTPLIEYKDE